MTTMMPLCPCYLSNIVNINVSLTPFSGGRSHGAESVGTSMCMKSALNVHVFRWRVMWFGNCHGGLRQHGLGGSLLFLP